MDAPTKLINILTVGSATVGAVGLVLALRTGAENLPYCEFTHQPSKPTGRIVQVEEDIVYQEVALGDDGTLGYKKQIDFGFDSEHSFSVNIGIPKFSGDKPELNPCFNQKLDNRYTSPYE